MNKLWWRMVQGRMHRVRRDRACIQECNERLEAWNILMGFTSEKQKYILENADRWLAQMEAEENI